MRGGIRTGNPLPIRIRMVLVNEINADSCGFVPGLDLANWFWVCRSVPGPRRVKSMRIHADPWSGSGTLICIIPWPYLCRKLACRHRTSTQHWKRMLKMWNVGKFCCWKVVCVAGTRQIRAPRITTFWPGNLPQNLYHLPRNHKS